MAQQIKETFPVKVFIKKSWTGKYYTIEIPPMKIRHETFLKIGDNLSSEAIKYGKEKDGRTYPEEIELLSNDVSMSSYDYKTGETRFSGSTKADVNKWLKLYKKYVYSDKF